MNKFFLLLLIGGLAVAYVLLTRPVPPEAVGKEAAPAAGADSAAETMAAEPQTSATTSAAPETTTHTVAPAGQSAPTDESRSGLAVETATEDQAGGITDQVREEARGAAEPGPLPTIDEGVDDTKTAEAPTVTGEAIEAAAPLAPPAPMAPAAATPDPSALPPDR